MSKLWFADEEKRDRFAAEVAWRLCINGKISPFDWEEIVAYSLGGKVYGGDVYLADVVIDKTQISVKSLKKSVVYRKTMGNKNIFNDVPKAFEVIERRVSIPFHPEEDPEKIGIEILHNQKMFEELSLKTYKLENTVDLLINYGFDDDRNPKFFGWRVYIYPRKESNYDSSLYRWDRIYFSEKSRHIGKIAKIVGYDKTSNNLVYYWNTPYNSRQTINLVRQFYPEKSTEIFEGKIKVPDRIKRPSDSELLAKVEFSSQ